MHLTYWLVNEIAMVYLLIVLVTYHVAKLNNRNVILAAILGIMFPIVSMIGYLLLGKNEDKQLDMKEYMERMHKEREDLADLQRQLEIKSHQDSK